MRLLSKGYSVLIGGNLSWLLAYVARLDQLV